MQACADATYCYTTTKPSAKARTVKVILNFLLERFATFRIEGHSMIDFDSTRWTKYAEILEGLINVSITEWI